VIGDFNVTPFSAVFKKFINTSKLSYCGYGHGYQPTWQKSPLLPPLRLALDHCFYSDIIEVLDFYTGEETGSDHLPIVVKMGWK
jgi:endonuclease/exonuclease/phosphatase (EEP) superfamily protein YafD